VLVVVAVAVVDVASMIWVVVVAGSTWAAASFAPEPLATLNSTPPQRRAPATEAGIQMRARREFTEKD
jgi:hypothetical protein